MDEGIATVYGWVRQSRPLLATALEALGPERYTAPQATLAGDSVRDRHVHMAQCYIHWVARVGLGEDVPDPRPADFGTPEEVLSLFGQADEAVRRLLERHAGRLDEEFERTNHDFTGNFTARWLLSHPITHEFHHKGQIAVVVRLFGVDPGDVDLFYPFSYRSA
jgi:uncharacterized damage-inducible protein DinB